MASPSDVSRPEAGAPAPSAPWRRRVGFAVRSVGRHPVLSPTVLLVVVAAVAVVALSPRSSYRSSATLVISADPVAEATGSSTSRGGSRSAEQIVGSMAPWLRSSAPATELVEDLGLVGRSAEGEGVLARARRSLVEVVTGPPSASEVRDRAIDRVRHGVRVDVVAGGPSEQTVVVSATWGSARTAQRIVGRAVNRWVAERRTAELTPLEDAVTVAQDALQDANGQVAELRASLGIPEAEDREVPASSPLRTAAAIQATAAQRFGAARVALAAARAAFDHRYRTVSPADRPVSPTGNPVPLLVGAVPIAYLVAVLVTTTLDRRRGRVVEPWQVTTRLGLTHLAHLGETR